ncbi:hypothetical protein [Pyxidicoccus sp. MSG2]|uniref:hypothetical protein n=1 Tax=Pyxidicoccus sp. MSG2 TaxID=2996790 RepID=UPI00226E4BF7|nr:hypothetical protein [Pyxidicoccus sp. MSG2]MCY1017674.1 hypothetical protein [Pyxidicoccus sp. MSG2]
MKWSLLALVLGMSGTGAAEERAPAPADASARPAASRPAEKAKPPKTAKPSGAAAAKPPAAAPPLMLPPPKTNYLPQVEDLEPEPLKEIPPDVKVPPVYRQPFVWDVPRVKDIIDVPGVMLADGIPVRMKAVRSAEKIEPLMGHIVDRWVEWGLYVAPPEQQPQKLREPMLTALDPERFITYTVIFQPNPDGTTTLYLGEADMSKPPGAMSTVAPVFPGAEGVLTSDLETVRSVTYSVRAKETEVDAFYKTELAKAGFKEVKPRRFRAGQEEVELILKPLQPGQQSVSVMRRTVGPEAATPGGD